MTTHFNDPDHDNLACGRCLACAECEALDERIALGLEPTDWEVRLLVAIEMDWAFGEVAEAPEMAAMDNDASGSWFAPDTQELVGV